uniref:Uncharacterized protein n=1 Tax=Grammatophora oceanica TaxID=210454 RepID=A0A7S1YJZ2_9STRA|mmetsp:Transcript_50962/g.76212  ORF Transcript_50962/g.76212 Transcript_50962/m.76212 type:complete len:198 (+) Transcript_50962:1015-1608(+)|eukprot:CAMPEP_0194070842 /NCGR_PEP_ID=MMETSP0009_2-20130614/88391_1 /TAXON_ID=210454 /ORGANISM="Grammatophora oceanica, Strain CCMP 410" /LENGTH=197 /DNA_ID=CAMNT_0038724129 /DNA_START=1049 /DNA_END=1642 /DNA_ORIENTATION=-
MKKKASPDSSLSTAQQWFQELRTSPLLLAWYTSALVTVIVPLAVFTFCRASFDRDGNVDENDELSLGALILAYSLSVLMFMAFVIFGHGHIRSPQDNGLFPMMLLIFAGWSLIASILAASNIEALDGKEWDERPWATNFPSCLVLTYGLWSLLGCFFSRALYVSTLKRNDAEEASGYRKVADYEDGSSCGCCLLSKK